MITRSVMQILQNGIQIYDKRCGKDYLIAFKLNKNASYKFVQLRIKQSNFWHLLGCGLEEDTPDGKQDTYLKCKNNLDVSEKVYQSYSLQTIEDKYRVVQHIFDFVDNAKYIKIAYVKNCPEEFELSVGMGNEDGIVGYAYQNYNNKGSLVPKSARLKPISQVSKNTHKVSLILSKNIEEKYYKTIEFESSPGIYNDVIKQMPTNIKVSL